MAKGYPPSLLGITSFLWGGVLLGGCSSVPSPKSLPSSLPPVPSPVVAPQFPGLVQPAKAESASDKQLQALLDQLQAIGSPAGANGIWLQTNTQFLAQHQGTIALPAASLTKVATSLAALETLGVDHRFVTQIGMVGTVKGGVLQGDLVVQGSQDPFFVWEDAIALGTLLNQAGIRQVKGNLRIHGPFYMNFAPDTSQSGQFLVEGLDAARWSAEAVQQYQTLPPNTPKPQLKITGTVRVDPALPRGLQPLAEHRSLPLVELLKRMNRYSNNAMAEMVADSIGGAQMVAQKAIAATGVSASEIQLVNGSGLAIENRISPRAVCALFFALGQYLQPRGMTIANLLTVVGQDEGILDGRSLPTAAVLKSGTLDTVSALAGALPTQKYGVVWFSILNGEGDVEGFRKAQEQFLAALQQKWGISATPLPAIQASSTQTMQAENRLLKQF
jgi:serine-type D-Ala-D-Ala carboxypeptidase/endopeptidase (penicillin-binding protein 4)